MSLYEVKLTDGVFCAHISEGLLPAIRDGKGGAVSEFMPGWLPESLFCGVSPINCLSLIHTNGKRATWYLDNQFNRIGGSFKEIHERHHSAFARLADQFEVAIHSRIVCCENEINQSYLDLTRINAAARHDITEYLLGGRLSSNDTIILQGANPNDFASAVESIAKLGAYPDVRRHLQALLEIDFKEMQTNCVRKASLDFPSPMDGSLQKCVGTLLLTDRAIAYRFLHNLTGFTYYLLAADWRHGVCAIYFPTISLTVYGNGNQRTAAENSLGGEFHKVMFRHASAQADNLDCYMTSPDKKLALVYSYWHLGHHLWNELSGLDCLLERIPPAKIPPIYILDAGRTEMYGRLEEIFPPLSGLVNRTLCNLDELRQTVYRGNWLCVRLNDSRVSRSLATRIIHRAQLSAAASDAPNQLKAMLRDGYQIILLGLRVENRTVVDFPQFCEELIAFLQLEIGKVAIVLDGHNRPEGATGAYISHRESSASQSPISVELDIIATLKMRFSNHSQIKIIDTVGEPMSASIFWSTHSRFFVTPWGAGLAKYRWVCNRPGLVLAGHLFQGQQFQHTLHLYDDPSYMESPSPIYFIDRGAVEDDPGAPLLIPDPSDSTRVNFRVNRDSLRSSLRQIIQSTAL